MRTLFQLYTHSKKSGFTLIELLVVIAIIGVLASVVLASLNNARRKSRDARRIADIKQIQLALEFYYDGTGARNYPTGTGLCPATPTLPGHDNGLYDLVLQKYILVVPRDPSNTATCYRYASGATPTSNRVSYHLAAVLEETMSVALNSDRDCTSVGTAGVVNCDSTVGLVWTGTQSNGSLSTNCVLGPVGAVDNCYDVIP